MHLRSRGFTAPHYRPCAKGWGHEGVSGWVPWGTQVLGCERLSGAFLEAASAEGEGRTGGEEPGEAEPPGRLSGGRSPARGRLSLQRRRLPAGRLEPQQPCRCRSPLGAAPAGLGPSRRVCCSPQAAAAHGPLPAAFPLSARLRSSSLRGSLGRTSRHPPQRALRE